jgi:hypothetical protein
VKRHPEEAKLGNTTGGSYDAGERRVLEQLLRRGEALLCPACGAQLSVAAVQPPGAVAYVRRRVWVLCPACRRTASLDRGRPDHEGS